VPVDRRTLPHPEDVLDARQWLLMGAPAASRDHHAPQRVRTLLRLMEALPLLHPVYGHGTPERQAAMAEVLIDERCPACGRAIPNDLHRQAMALAREKGLITAPALQEATGCSTGTSHNTLSELAGRGLLKRIGRGRYEP
jgi:predicted HTH transcriptional regulator